MDRGGESNDVRRCRAGENRIDEGRERGREGGHEEEVGGGRPEWYEQRSGEEDGRFHLWSEEFDLLRLGVEGMDRGGESNDVRRCRAGENRIDEGRERTREGGHEEEVGGGRPEWYEQRSGEEDGRFHLWSEEFDLLRLGSVPRPRRVLSAPAGDRLLHPEGASVRSPRRSHLDGDQDPGNTRRQEVLRGCQEGVPPSDARIQPQPLLQLGRRGHDRRSARQFQRRSRQIGIRVAIHHTRGLPFQRVDRYRIGTVVR
mmetsp:Transcript_4601/g.12925  ORF Transcript_4601/g.12925 Transcript_4601/m.12925 type:complete len:257 (-) Transcript_4601:753-1523(-)